MGFETILAPELVDEHTGQGFWVDLRPDRRTEGRDAQAQHPRPLEGKGVAKQYWPERLEILPELPETPSGKTRKLELRDQVKQTGEGASWTSP